MIASNPSASIQLLDQLALHNSREVLVNPLLQFSALETGGAYGGFSLSSLVCLCLVCDPKRDPDLLKETRRRIQSSLEELLVQDYASLECEWLFARDFSLLPENCDGIIDKPLDFALQVRKSVDANGGISFLSELPRLDDSDLGSPGSQRILLARFLRDVAAGKIHDYIDDDDLTREDTCEIDFDLKAEDLPSGYSIDGRALRRDGETILEFGYNFDMPDSLVVFEGRSVTVPLEFQDEVNHRYEIAMGELGDLPGLESKCPALPSDWHQRLAALLIP